MRPPPSSSMRAAALARSPAASFLLAAAATAAVVGGLYFWVVVSSFRLPDSGAAGCRADGEGSWSVGMFYGSSPFELRSIELVSGVRRLSLRQRISCAGLTPEVRLLVCNFGHFGGQEGRSNGNSSAWPVANPVLTCATPTEAGYPSNFVADPFLYVEVSVAAALPWDDG